jgi:hypothetical protein
MSPGLRFLRIACALGLLGTADASIAQTYYSLQGGSGAQVQIGDELPLPIWLVYSGLPNPTMTVFPPLLIAPNANPAKALVKQTAGPDPKKITIPPGALRRAAPGAKFIGAAKQNTRIFQVRTNIEFSAPAPALGSAVLQAGGRTGAPIATFTGPAAA